MSQYVHMYLTMFGKLQVFYVDRVEVFSEKTVERKNPAFLGWTTQLLKTREEQEIKYKGFGAGHDDGPTKQERALEVQSDDENSVEEDQNKVKPYIDLNFKICEE